MLVESLPLANDPRAVPILAKSLYRELRTGGLTEKEVLAIAGELLSLIADDVRTRQPQSAG